MAERKPRVIVEIAPDEEMLVRRARAAAILRGQSFRDWVMEAIREKLERE